MEVIKSSRGRKTNYVTKITSNDEKMLRAFSNVGYINEKMIKEELQIADRRIKNFARDGYLEKVSYLNKNTKDAEFAFRLTTKGKDLCSKKLGVEYFYKSTSVQHDLCLADKYFSLDETIRKNWITEREWREKFEVNLNKLRYEDFSKWMDLSEKWRKHEISPTDGGYSVDGQLIAIEIVTNSYSKLEIDSKIEFSKILNLEYTQYKT